MGRVGIRGSGRAGRIVAVTAVLGALAAGCSAPQPPPPVQVAQLATPAAAVTVLGTDDPAALAVATSGVLYASSPVVVLAGVENRGAQEAAAPTARRLGVPLLLTPAGADPAAGDPAGVRAELLRLSVTTVLTVGDAAARWASSMAGPARMVADEGELPPVGAPEPLPSLVVLAQDAPGQLAATTTALGAGATVDVVPPDPRRATQPVPAGDRVVALGAAFGTPRQLTNRLAVAATGVQLPGGGQVLFPARRLVALYGLPGVPALGVLGEQGIAESVTRAKALAKEYEPVSGGDTVVPAFEIITTVADAAPGPDGDYSAESAVETLRPWVDAARDAGVYVLLDLQPGRTDFLTQARRYEELLAQPHVGLALDPEWRLTPTQVHREQIGSVGVDEVNRVVTWLADLTRDRALPQKMLMLHQFRTYMIVGRERLDTSRDELAVVIHSDGFGTHEDKLETWNALHVAEPPAVHWGWKNFIDEDSPTFTPAETAAVGPTPPAFVSYQ